MGVRLTKGEYESFALRTLRRYLLEQDPRLRYDGKILVEDVRLDTSGPEHMVEILFRDEAHPRCLFGWRFPATEADEPHPRGDDQPDPWATRLRGPEQAEIWASTFVLTNFVEQIEAASLGLPSECEAGGVTWVGDYKP